MAQDLRRQEELRGFAVRAVPAVSDKVTRAIPWAALASGGMVHLVQGPWIQAFLDEVVLFPAAAHDDQVDAVSGGYGIAITHRVGRIYWV